MLEGIVVVLEELRRRVVREWEDGVQREEAVVMGEGGKGVEDAGSLNLDDGEPASAAASGSTWEMKKQGCVFEPEDGRERVEIRDDYDLDVAFSAPYIPQPPMEYSRNPR